MNPDHDQKCEAFRARMLIDTGNLDEECRSHAYHHAEIALEHALAQSRVEELKVDRHRVEAGECDRIRRELHEQGAGDGPKGRVTDKQVEAASASSDAVRQADLAYGTAKRQAQEWGALREASRERGYQLRNLVDMQVVGLSSPDQAIPTRRATGALERSSGYEYEDYTEPDDRVRL